MSAGVGALVGGGMAAGAIGGVASSLISANAADKAGQLQYQQAQKELELAQKALDQQISNRATGISQAQTAATMSPDEIKNINSMLTTQLSSLSASLGNISKMQGQLDAMDPQVKAAGKNFYDLLTGKSAAILEPLQKQQQIQRQQMQDQMASQMGPGWMTSSAGIQAMVNFDNQTAITTNQAQMQALQTVGSQYMATAGMQQQGQYGIGAQTLNAYGQSIATAGQVAGAYASNTALKTNATLGAMSANQINPFGVPNAQGAVVSAAPGTQAGNAMMGQGIGNVVGGIGQTASSFGAMQMYGNMFGPKGGGDGGGYTGNFGSTIAGAGGGPSLGVNTSMPMPANPF